MGGIVDTTSPHRTNDKLWAKAYKRWPELNNLRNTKEAPYYPLVAHMASTRTIKVILQYEGWVPDWTKALNHELMERKLLGE